ncbi:MAG: major capsid protein [Clostridiaceae bacterium]
MNLQDFISSSQIALYIQNLPPETTIDEVLFTNSKQWGTEIELAKGSKQKPVALRMSTFDVAVKSRALSASLDLKKKELPFFKESILIREKDRQMLMMAMQSNNQNLVENLMGQVFDNYKALVDGAAVQARRMRAQALQKGQINIVTTEGDVVVDYEVPADHKETLLTTARWSQTATADIIGDIIRWQKAITDDGYSKPKRMLLTTKTFGYVATNAAIIAAIKGTTNMIVTDVDILDYLNRKVDIQVGILNGTFINEAGDTVNFYEDELATLIPEGVLGKTIYGTTPEEADKVYGTGKLDTSIVNTGVAITTMLKEDPVTVETKVSQLVLPSFERADECFFAVVHA